MKKQYTIISVPIWQPLLLSLLPLFHQFTIGGLILGLIVFLAFNLSIKIFSGWEKKFSENKAFGLMLVVLVVVASLCTADICYFKYQLLLCVTVAFCIVVPMFLVAIASMVGRRFEQKVF